jgi:hypothetical protein
MMTCDCLSAIFGLMTATTATLVVIAPEPSYPSSVTLGNIDRNDGSDVF